MYINEQYQNLELIENETHDYIGRDGQEYEEEEPVLAEHLIDIFINERLTMKVICSPQHLAELVIGRLFTESMISSVDDVESIYICEHGSRAKVLLKKQETERKTEFVETTPSCCTGNHVLNDYFVNQREVSAVEPIPWKRSWIFDLADTFREGMPLHNQTFATHSCFLAQEGKLLFKCEDIGRHNALDKVIGYALKNEIDLRKCVVYSSGRVPTDMIMKVIRAGIPVFASKASPTREAIWLAERYHLTLVCAARSDRMKLYTGERPCE